MPVLGWLKGQRLNNPAVAADAVQPATCAYLVGIALIGLGLKAAFHIGPFDSAAALNAVPLLLKEGREAWLVIFRLLVNERHWRVKAKPSANLLG